MLCMSLIPLLIIYPHDLVISMHFFFSSSLIISIGELLRKVVAVVLAACFNNLHLYCRLVALIT